MIEFIASVLTVIALFCMVTAFLDMGMNGSANAGWAPWGLGIALVCFVVTFNM